jgi:hypothetical protein
VVKLGDIGAGHVRRLPPAELRQDDLFEQPAVFGRGAALALRVGMLGEEALGEFSDRRGFPPGHLVGGRVRAVLDHAEQRLCLFARRLGCPGRTVPADRQLAQRRAPAAAGAVVQHVALGSAALHARAKALQLGIPQHRFGAICRRLQRIHRALGDLAAHRPGSCPRISRLVGFGSKQRFGGWYTGVIGAPGSCRQFPDG